MNLENIKSIQLSLLYKKSEIDSSTGKAVYEKKVTAKFTFPIDFPKNEESLQTVCQEMYADLLKNVRDESDYLGIWIEYDSITLDNAVSLKTLQDIMMYSKDNVYPIYEFFKMTIQNYEAII